MELVSIDKKKCKQDAICVNQCPMKILGMDDQTGFPSPNSHFEELCMNCGHCVAICPQGALSLSRMDIRMCEPINGHQSLSKESIVQLLKTRRSVRQFKDQKLDMAILEQLIQIASYAPSPKNLQPLEWKVIYDPLKVRDISLQVIEWMQELASTKPSQVKKLGFDRLVDAYDKGNDLILYNSPHLILTYASQKESAASQASSIALACLEIAASAFDLGTCWAGYLHTAISMSSKIRKSFDLPQGFVVTGAMMIGYPNVRFHRIPARKKSKITWN